MSTIIKRRKQAAAVLCLVAFVSVFVLGDARAVVSAQTAAGYPADAPARFSHLDVETFTLPPHLGSVKFSGKGSSGRIVIHIQDAHADYYAQQKISGIIDYLNKEYGIRMVNLEGGTGDYDLAIFTSISGDAIRREVADYFVKTGEINGAEFYAINNPDRVVLWGVENKELYLANLKVYRDSLKYKTEVDGYLAELTHVLDNLKRHIYTPELLRMDAGYNAYKGGNMDFREYLEFLIKEAKDSAVLIRNYPNIYLLSQAMALEDKVDFKKANMERNTLVDDLKKQLSKKELRDLVEKSVNFKTKKISRKVFYDYLLKKAGELNLDVTRFPALSNYIVYVTIYESVDRGRVMSELDSFEAAIKEPMYRNATQRKLNALSRHLALMKNIFEISLTKSDYKYYLANENAFDVNNFTAFIAAEAPAYRMEVRLSSTISKIDEYRREIVKFYKYSFERDDAFMRNMRFTRTPGGSEDAILMTGGFHTENLCEKLNAEGISYVSIMPKFIDEKGYENPYFDLLAGQTADVQRMLTSALAKASTMQIASMLTTLGEAVWGRANIDAFYASVYIREQLVKNKDLRIALLDDAGVSITMPDGEPMIFGEGNAAPETMTVKALMDAVHQREIDAQMERLAEDRFEDMVEAETIVSEMEEFLKSIGANKKTLERVRALTENNAAGRALIRFVSGVTFRGHAGGEGIRINSIFKEDAKALRGVIAHEIMAGLFGDHFLAQNVEQAFLEGRAGENILTAAAPLTAAIWEMTPAERLKASRDYIAGANSLDALERSAGDDVAETLTRMIARTPENRRLALLENILAGFNRLPSLLRVKLVDFILEGRYPGYGFEDIRKNNPSFFSGLRGEVIDMMLARGADPEQLIGLLDAETVVRVMDGMEDPESKILLLLMVSPEQRISLFKTIGQQKRVLAERDEAKTELGSGILKGMVNENGELNRDVVDLLTGRQEQLEKAAAGTAVTSAAREAIVGQRWLLENNPSRLLVNILLRSDGKRESYLWGKLSVDALNRDVIRERFRQDARVREQLEGLYAPAFAFDNFLGQVMTAEAEITSETLPAMQSKEFLRGLLVRGWAAEEGVSITDEEVDKISGELRDETIKGLGNVLAPPEAPHKTLIRTLYYLRAVEGSAEIIDTIVSYLDERGVRDLEANYFVRLATAVISSFKENLEMIENTPNARPVFSEKSSASDEAYRAAVSAVTEGFLTTVPGARGVSFEMCKQAMYVVMNVLAFPQARGVGRRTGWRAAVDTVTPERVPGVFAGIVARQAGAMLPASVAALMGNVKLPDGTVLTGGFTINEAADFIEVTHERMEKPIRIYKSDVPAGIDMTGAGMAGVLRSLLLNETGYLKWRGTLTLNEREKIFWLINLMGAVDRVVPLGDNKDFLGIYDVKNGDGIIYLNKDLILNPLSLLHELGEGFVELPEEYPALTRHTYMRGAGKDARTAYDLLAKEMTLETLNTLTAEEFITALDRKMRELDMRLLTDSEKALIEYNFTQQAERDEVVDMGAGSLLFGLQDNLDPALNIAFTQEVRGIIDELRRDSLNFILIPAVNLQTASAQATLGTETARKFRRAGVDTRVSHYSLDLEDQLKKIIDEASMDINRGFFPEIFVYCLTEADRAVAERYRTEYPGLVAIGNDVSEDMNAEDIQVEEVKVIAVASEILNDKRLSEDFDMTAADLAETRREMLERFTMLGLIDIGRDLQGMTAEGLADVMRGIYNGEILLKITRVNWQEIKDWSDAQAQIERSL
ncbi:MAG: hypothetical protein ABIH74_02395 [Candidatus Omnitrophota bacterium]